MRSTVAALVAVFLLAAVGNGKPEHEEQQFAYTGDFHAGYVYRIDLADGAFSRYTPGQLPGGGLDFDSHGDLFCVEGNAILEVSPDGKTVVPFVEGLKNGLGLAVDSMDNVCCTEYLNKTGKVYRFRQPKAPADLPIKISYLDDAGKDYRITPEGSGTAIDDGLTLPYGLFGDAHGNIYVNMLGNHVYKYTQSGEKIDMGQGAGWGRTAVVDAHGDLYSTGFNIIKVSNGQAVGMFAPGTDFRHSVGIALDSEGNVYQGNPGEGTGNGTVFKYTPDGRRSVFARHVGDSPFWIAMWPRTKD